jgi:Tol biopolymer transport system component
MVDPKADGAAVPTLLQGDLGVTELLGLSKEGTLYYDHRTQSRDVYLATLDPSSLRAQGQPVRFVNTYLGHNSSPVWSPSGDSFAYVSFRDINGKSRMVVRGNNGNEVAAAEINQWDFQTPTWCSDSRLLNWGTPHPATRRLYDATTGAVAGPDSRIMGLRPAYQLGYAPDCRSVYVSARVHGSGRREIYRLDLDTQQRTELYSDDAEWSLAPTVSPDGKWLAMVGRLVRGGPTGVLLMPTAGGVPRMLAREASDNMLTWTPDSKHIFYMSFRDAKEEILAVSIDGGEPVATGIRGRGLIGPSLHPDGKRALYSQRESTAEVWSLRNFMKK